MILWNSFVYWKTYSLGGKKQKMVRPKLVINKWILTRWNQILKEVTEKLEVYNIVVAARWLETFVIDYLSHWYIQRIREHMKDAASAEARECSQTLGLILLELSTTLAPFAPFIAEGIYKGVGGGKESVHLEDWPEVDRKLKIKNNKLAVEDWARTEAIRNKILEKMDKVREIVSKGLEVRQKAGIKIRQPLSELRTGDKEVKELEEGFISLIKGGANVENVVFVEDLKERVELDTTITPELKEKGLVREFIRQVQDFRKELKLRPQEKVLLSVSGDKKLEEILKQHAKLVKKEISVSGFEISSLAGDEKEIPIDGKNLKIGIQK